jgi:hypothetical protein
MGMAADDPYGILAGASCLGAAGAEAQLLETLARGAYVPLAPPPAPEGASPGDCCEECGCALEVIDLHYECPNCHALMSAADYGDVQPVSVSQEAGEGALRGRLRVVGADAGWYQPDMDRNNPGEYSETQKKTTYAELRRFNEEFRNRGGNPFPLNVLSDVADRYNIIQQRSVKRSAMKRNILSALLVHCCIDHGFTRTKAEAAEFAKLRSHGIARGDDYIREVDEDVGLNGLDMNRDRLDPEITTTFCKLELGGEECAAFRAATRALVRHAEASLIGIRSVLRSKVIATTCEVLVRARVSDGQRAEGPALPSPAEVIEKCKIRKHTISRFRQELADHHSLFAPVYAAHGLTAAPIAEVEAATLAPPVLTKKAGPSGRGAHRGRPSGARAEPEAAVAAGPRLESPGPLPESAAGPVG